MKDSVVIITSVILLLVIVLLATNYSKITGNVVSGNVCQLYDRYGFQAFSEQENPYGKVTVAAADINLDGITDIITGAGEHGKSKIAVYSITGKKLLEFNAFTDMENPNGDVYVAAGDIDMDNIADIVVGSGIFGKSIVKIFDHDGDFINKIKAFSEQENPYGKVTVAAADLDKDGDNEIIVGTSTGGSSKIKIFDYKGIFKSSFKAFNLQNQGGEVYVAAGDVLGDEKKEIIVGTGEGGTSKIALFDAGGKRLKEFSAMKTSKGAVMVAAGDITSDGKEEIIAGSGKYGNVIYVYNGKGRSLYRLQPFINNNPDGEIFVSSANLLRDYKKEIISSTGNSGTSYIDITEIRCNIDISCTDKDNDGSCYEDDCLDINPLVYPDALELCDKMDNNCNGVIDEVCPK